MEEEVFGTDGSAVQVIPEEDVAFDFLPEDLSAYTEDVSFDSFEEDFNSEEQYTEEQTSFEDEVQYVEEDTSFVEDFTEGNGENFYEEPNFEEVSEDINLDSSPDFDFIPEEEIAAEGSYAEAPQGSTAGAEVGFDVIDYGTPETVNNEYEFSTDETFIDEEVAEVEDSSITDGNLVEEVEIEITDTGFKFPVEEVVEVKGSVEESVGTMEQVGDAAEVLGGNFDPGQALLDDWKPVTDVIEDVLGDDPQPDYHLPEPDYVGVDELVPDYANSDMTNNTDYAAYEVLPGGEGYNSSVSYGEDVAMTADDGWAHALTSSDNSSEPIYVDLGGGRYVLVGGDDHSPINAYSTGPDSEGSFFDNVGKNLIEADYAAGQYIIDNGPEIAKAIGVAGLVVLGTVASLAGSAIAGAAEVAMPDGSSYGSADAAEHALAPAPEPIQVSYTEVAITPSNTLLPSDAVGEVIGGIAAPDLKPYQVQSGDTLWDIANRYGTTVDAMVAANPGINPDVIGVGQAINLPAGYVAGTYSAPVPSQQAQSDWIRSEYAEAGAAGDLPMPL